MYADRFRWGPFGTVVAHLSLILVMLGFVVSATTGFKDKAFIAPVGVPVSVGHGTGLVVEAKSFTDAYYDNGAPKDYVSDLALTKDGQQVARHETRVNSPLIYDGVWFHQSSFGNGADVTVTEGGKAVYSGLVPLQWQSDDGQQSIGQLTIPSRGITVFVVEAASGPGPRRPARRLGPARGAQDRRQRPPRRTGREPGRVRRVVDGLTYTYERNRQYTGLRSSRTRARGSSGSARRCWCSAAAWSSSCRTAGSGCGSTTTPTAPPASWSAPPSSGTRASNRSSRSSSPPSPGLTAPSAPPTRSDRNAQLTPSSRSSRHSSPPSSPASPTSGR